MFVLWSLQAAADLAPPPILPPPCLIETQCDETEEGVTCRESDGDPEGCVALPDQGYTRRCASTPDAEGRQEAVYCRTRTEHAPIEGAPAPTDMPGSVVPPSHRRCATAAGGGSIALSLSLLAIARRRMHA